MILDFSVLTQKELNTRKWWRRVFFIFPGLLLFFVAIGLVGLAFTSEKIVLELLISIFGILIFCTPFFIFYHCAYEMAGTKLLGCCLCFQTFKMLVIGIILCLPRLFPMNLTMLIPLSIIACCFTLNWKLRKINKKLQLTASYPTEYMAELELLTKTLARTDCDISYRSLVQQWPQFERHTTSTYKQYIRTFKQESAEIN